LVCSVTAVGTRRKGGIIKQMAITLYINRGGFETAGFSTWGLGCGIGRVVASTQNKGLGIMPAGNFKI